MYFTLLSDIKGKKPIKTKYHMPLFNWQALKPNQVTGTVFNELDDEQVLGVRSLNRYTALSVCLHFLFFYFLLVCVFFFKAYWVSFSHPFSSNHVIDVLFSLSFKFLAPLTLLCFSSPASFSLCFSGRFHLLHSGTAVTARNLSCFLFLSFSLLSLSRYCFWLSCQQF